MFAVADARLYWSEDEGRPESQALRGKSIRPYAHRTKMSKNSGVSLKQVRSSESRTADWEKEMLNPRFTEALLFNALYLTSKACFTVTQNACP